MKNEWKSLNITDAYIAVYVPKNNGRHIHKNRPWHGFVLNDAGAVRDYCFSDGRVLRTDGGSLFYLPRGSSYYVRQIELGGCYAINFDADISDEPFSVNIKNYETLKKSFRIAADEWRAHSEGARAAAMRALYDAVYLLLNREREKYIPSGRMDIVRLAEEAIESELTSPNLSVSRLALQAGISEVYFRKIFSEAHGVSPKEYIIERRMEYARELLTLGELEVSKIAEMCGYTEPCHFSREFKRRFGVPPKGYGG